jgi:hypothetical protein
MRWARTSVWKSMFIQPRHHNMYWNACVDRHIIPGSEIGGIPRNVTIMWPDDARSSAKKHGFWRGFFRKDERRTSLMRGQNACGRWREPYHLVSVALRMVPFFFYSTIVHFLNCHKTSVLREITRTWIRGPWLVEKGLQ